MEDPEPLAGADVEAAHIPFSLLLLFGTPPDLCAAPTITTFRRDGGVGVQADLAGDQIHLLIVVQLEIDHAVLAETGTGTPVLASSAINR